LHIVTTLPFFYIMLTSKFSFSSQLSHPHSSIAHKKLAIVPHLRIYVGGFGFRAVGFGTEDSDGFVGIRDAFWNTCRHALEVEGGA
jgi:hypothetical protein